MNVVAPSLELQHRVERARFMIFDKLPFFGAALARLPIVYVDDMDKWAGSATACTDFRSIFFHVPWVSQFSAEQLSGLTYHEVAHVLFGHNWRQGNRDPQRANVAMDHAVNLLFGEFNPGQLQLPPNGHCDPRYKGLSWEEIYEKLPTNAGEQPWGGHGMWGQGDLAPGSEASQELAEQWDDVLRSTLGGTQDWGKLPASLRRLVDTALSEQIHWRTLLYRHLSRDRGKYTLDPPDKRFASDDLFMFWLKPSRNFRDFVFCYDESGSMSAADINATIAESRNMLAAYPRARGTAMVGDARVHYVGPIADIYKPEAHVGGGGTDFRPFFAKVEELRLRPKVLAFFTDGYGTFPKDAPNYPVLWICSTDCAIPWGTVVRWRPELAVAA